MLNNLRRLRFRALFAITAIFTVFAMSALFSSVKADSAVPELDTDVTPLSGQSLVNSVLGGGLTASDITSHGTIYTFTHGVDIVGINAGIILDTSGRVEPNSPNDPDIAPLIDSSYSYGGHTSSLEFTIESTGTLLNFNYVFVSTEFNQNPRFNDVFGLFVSINGGPYENIATIPVATGLVPVSINSLRSGVNSNNEVKYDKLQANHQYSLFNSTRININNSVQPINGVSNVFNAQKTVSPGDTVKIKFAIADVSDSAFDSYVLIEANSLSFEEQMARINYQREVIEKLYSGRNYEISTGEETYTFTSSSNGEIPLAGTDKNGKEYDFMGEGISIVRKGIGALPDSDPQVIVVAGRPGAPDDISVPTGNPDDMYLDNIEITEDSITLSGSDGQEYSIDLVDWQSPGTSGHVSFSNLEPNTEYTVYTRYAATDDAPASEPTSGVTIVTQNMARNLIYNIFNYEGMYDGNSHSAYVSEADGAEVRYSEDLYGTYSATVPTYTEPGNYTVYYYLSREHYYPAYGMLYVRIKDYDVVNTTDYTTNFGNAKLLQTSAQLKSMFVYDDATKESLADAQTPAKISLVSSDVTDTVDEEIASQFASKLEEDEHLGKIIDFSLNQDILGDITKLTDLSSPVGISFKIPDVLILDSETAVRSYRLLHLHNDVVTEVDAEMDNDRNLNFASSKFSYFAITYTDHTIEPVITDDESDSDDDNLLVPDTSGNLLTPDTGEMAKTLDGARICAISTIIISIISALIARLCCLRIRR